MFYKRFLETIEEVLDPGHTVLVVIDMQNDFCSPEGAFAVRGCDVSRFPAAIETIARLLAFARAGGVPVAHVHMAAAPGFETDSSVQRRFNRRVNPEGTDLAYTVEGTWGAEVVPGLEPLPGEPIVRKRRSSAFWGTELDQVLRSRGFRTLVVCGATTEGCVESTARDAMFNDYHVVVVEDGVASLSREQHEASMTLMLRRFDVLPAAEIERIWAETLTAAPA